MSLPPGQRRSRAALAILVLVLLPGLVAAESDRPAPPPGPAPKLHVTGPPLTRLNAKLADPNWLVAWLLEPARLRPHSLMRAFPLRVEEAQAVARYLYVEPAPAPSGVEWRGGDARHGEELFLSRGCRGCHAIGSEGPPAESRAPHLAGIGAKVRGDWLYQWLSAPREYDPDTPMPRIALSENDIRDLVAFLMSHREGAEAVAAAPRWNADTASDAVTVIARFDCPKCHLIRGFQTAEPTYGQTFLPSACAGCHVSSGPLPVLDGSRHETERALRDGRLLVTYYSCRGCHRIEGRGGSIAELFERKSLAPPSLEGEGARVQASWLVDFLLHPGPLRPELTMRMPDFGFSETEAQALARYFAALDRMPASDEAVPPAGADEIALGKRRFDHYKCVQCHLGEGEQMPQPTVDPEDLSIDLERVRARLRPTWVRDFLARPKEIAGTHTRMPGAFYTVDGIPKVDHPQRDIGAITAYLFHMAEGDGR